MLYARRLLTNRGTEPLVLSATQLTLGACLIGVVTPWLERQQITLTSTVVLSVVALGVLSTGIAYVLNYRGCPEFRGTSVAALDDPQAASTTS
jgi:drug/metabolite transporter (DMT)-like permease